MGNTIKLILAFIGLLIGIIVVAVFGFGVIRYQRFQATGSDLLAETTLTQVGITNLSNGAEAEIGHPLQIEGFAAGPNAFLSLQLWIDGQPASVQSAYSLGNSPFETSFTWLPDTPGAHSLLLRAFDDTQQVTNSTPVIVLVPEQAADETNDVAASSGDGDDPVVFPSGGGGGSYVSPAPSGDDTVGEAGDWSASPGDWLDSLFPSDQAPEAPELAATAGQCSASLSIHDLSDNELGFKLQRYLPSFNQWVEIATLDAQSQDDWLMVTDAGISGAVQYQVIAYNQVGNAASNVVPVNIDPASCPEIQAELGVVNFTLQSLGTQFPMDMAYCYRSFDGGADWERWPASDFFYPDEDGSLNVQLASFSLFTAIGEPAVETFDLMLECWGWGGGELALLGTYEAAGVDPLQGGLYPIGSGDSELVFGIAPENVLHSPEFFPLNNFTAQYQEVDPFELEHVLSEFAPEEREMPGIHLAVTYDADICAAHLPPENQNLFGRIVFCFPYPGFDSQEQADQGGVNPQPFLVWSFDLNGCRAAFYDPSECKSYDYYLEQAELTGGQVKILIYDSSSATPHEQNAPGFTQFVIPPLDCQYGQRRFNVQMFYKPGPNAIPQDPQPPQAGLDTSNNQYTQVIQAGLAGDLALSKLSFAGPISNLVDIPCPEPIGDNVQVEITFNTMTLSGLDDGPDDLDDVEIYGFLWADLHSPLSGGDRYLNIATWQASHTNCDATLDEIPEQYRDLENRINWLILYGCPHVFAGFDSPVNFADMYACDSSHREDCALDLHNPTRTSYTNFEIGNNALRVDVGDGDSLDVSVEFWDYDEASADDLLCLGSFHLEARNIFEWSQVNETGSLSAPPQSSGSCLISFSVQAVP